VTGKDLASVVLGLSLLVGATGIARHHHFKALDYSNRGGVECNEKFRSHRYYSWIASGVGFAGGWLSIFGLYRDEKNREVERK
jgi:hypothetical protein